MMPKIEEISYQDPAQVFTPFANNPFSLFFDSSLQDKKQGRYAFIATHPCMTLTEKNGVCRLNGKHLKRNPFEVLETLLKGITYKTIPGLPPFQGGAAGYFGYELARHLETLPIPNCDDLEFPDLAIGLYDTVLSFDLLQKRAWIISHSAEAENKIQDMKQKIQSSYPEQYKQTNHHPLSWLSNFTPADYKIAVQNIVNYIHAGDIFQANLSQRFTAHMPEGTNPYRTYLDLREHSPSCFSGYMNFGAFQIASNSPERFLKIKNRSIETQPIKGTRARGKNADQDRAHAKDLINSPKDRAENAMIVDLLRNDLSRVCEDYSIKVPELCTLKSYATVHHLVSTVTGRLHKDMGPIDALKACFPGGSITGAPKIRAMEIISEIEPHARGPYCGSMGYIGFDGTMDSNITIRTLCFKDQKVTFHVGGGVVAESCPSAEYNETLDKAAALFGCFDKKQYRDAV